VTATTLANRCYRPDWDELQRSFPDDISEPPEGIFPGLESACETAR